MQMNAYIFLSFFNFLSSSSSSSSLLLLLLLESVISNCTEISPFSCMVGNKDKITMPTIKRIC